MKERQELHCHACDQYVQFDVDLSLNGKHVITCPNCQHEHLRYVNKGIISDRRWGSRNTPQMVYYATNSTSTLTSYMVVSATATTAPTAYYMADAWLNSLAS